MENFTPLFKLFVAYVKHIKKDLKIRENGSTEGVHLSSALKQPYKAEKNNLTIKKGEKNELNYNCKKFRKN